MIRHTSEQFSLKTFLKWTKEIFCTFKGHTMKTLELSKINADNPVPFVQPLLVLRFKETDENGWKMSWFVDVNGEIGKYLSIDSDVCACVNPEDPLDKMMRGGLIWMQPLLRQLIDDLAKNGLHVEHVGSYGPGASGGPSHILRNGVLFERIS